MLKHEDCYLPDEAKITRCPGSSKFNQPDPIQDLT
jgi:hypothetical protein